VETEMMMMMAAREVPAATEGGGIHPMHLKTVSQSVYTKMMVVRASVTAEAVAVAVTLRMTMTEPPTSAMAPAGGRRTTMAGSNGRSTQGTPTL